MSYFDIFSTNNPIIKCQSGNKIAETIGPALTKTADVLTGANIKRQVSDAVREAAASTDNEFLRFLGNAFGMINSGIYDIAQSRVNNKLNQIFPGWVPEKAKDQIGIGEPVWTVDKGSRIARYYDANGNLLLSSPAGIGMVTGAKKTEGDNKTPTGSFKLSAPENGRDKKGGYFSFGNHFYRTNHRNDNKQLSGVGLHGTGRPFFNGTNLSHGCVRLDNDVIDQFYEIAPKHGAGTKVIMYDKYGGKL